MFNIQTEKYNILTATLFLTLQSKTLYQGSSIIYC